MHRSYGQLSKFSKGVKTHLVRENEGKFYFVSCFGIPTTTQDERTWGTSRNGRDKTERRHCWTEDGWCQGASETVDWEMRPRKHTPPDPIVLLAAYTQTPIHKHIHATTMSFLSRRVFLRPAIRSTSLLSLGPARRTLITLQDNLVRCPFSESSI